MKNTIIPILMMGAAAHWLCCAQRVDAQTTGAANSGPAATVDGLPATPRATADDSWPMTFTDAGTRYTIFEPQCDSWDGHLLVARSAVAIQSPGQSQPAYGVISFNAITLVDKTARTATLADFKLTRSNFPASHDPAQDYLVSVLIHYSKNAPPVPLDHLESSLTLSVPVKTEPLNNMPPKIIVATRPAVLVYVDGPPAWRPVTGTSLLRAINTRMLLLKDLDGRYYLHLYDGYLQATALDGPWTVASLPPAGADTALKAAGDSGQVDLMSGSPDPVTQKEPSLGAAPAPDIYVATRPSELITFNGAPEYAAIPGTDLLYAANTSGNVFKLLTDQQNYILIAGRWYRAAALTGPWQFVSGTELPKDFANIPDNSPKENVKASVPGTAQAEEALIANSIPQSTAVARSTQMPAPALDGALQLAPIDGTPLHYVQNSATPIIEVDPQTWYSCQNGVWYVSTSASGPWQAATSVPAVIYTIPPTSPLHYLTYVQIYDATPTVVYEGYTPGYMGTEVANDGTVVYGTGYDYNPWIGSVWYGPPITYGCGFDACWTPWWGWGFGCGFGWGCGGFALGGCYPPSPWWGGYCGWAHDYGGWNQGYDRWEHGQGGWNGGGYRRFGDGGYGGWANTGANIYHPDGHLGGNRFTGSDLNHSSVHGWAGAFGQAYNSRTGQLAAGQRARVQNVSGSTWNLGRPTGYGQNHSFGSYVRRGPANAADWSAPASAVHPAATGPAARSEWSGGAFQNRVLNAPKYGSVNRGFQNNLGGNWRGGGAFNVQPSQAQSRGGGWFHSMGNFFHGSGNSGGGGGGGGGGHAGGWSGGSGGWSGGSGGSSGGGGWSGGGHAGGGGGGWGGGGHR